jgi:hypothetical protein
VNRRRFLNSSTAFVVAAASAWAALSALGELLGSALSSSRWGIYVVYAAAVTIAVVGVIYVVRIFRRPRSVPVSDPQLRDLLRELETEQAKFDVAMRAKAR